MGVRQQAWKGKRQSGWTRGWDLEKEPGKGRQVLDWDKLQRVVHVGISGIGNGQRYAGPLEPSYPEPGIKSKISESHHSIAVNNIFL